MSKEKKQTKLKQLQINKIDLVDAGANPGADVLIFKRDDSAEEDEQATMLEKAFNALAKALGIKKEDEETPDEIAKMQKHFNQHGAESTTDEIESAIRMSGYGLAESMIQILKSDTENKREAMRQNLDDFQNVMNDGVDFWLNGLTRVDLAKSISDLEEDQVKLFKSAAAWLNEQVDEEEVDENEVLKEDEDDEEEVYPELDVNDEDIVEDADENQKDDEDPEDEEEESEMNKEKLNKSKEQEDIYKGLHPEVAKELQELKKFKADKEDEELMEICKGYEVTGQKAEDIFKMLKPLRDNQEAYDSVIKALDTAKNTVENSGMFDEIGKSGNRAAGVGANAAFTAIQKKADEIMEKEPELSRPEAIDKAFLLCPDHLAELDQ